MQFKCIEKHIFSGISDCFRLFLTEALTPLSASAVLDNCKDKYIPIFMKSYNEIDQNLRLQY